MTHYYSPTHLETWISLRYKRLNILTPQDLTEERICKAYRIFFKRWDRPSFSINEGNLKMISINSTLHYSEQREQFFHELCHVLRHTGRQLMMPKAFRELQEWDANNFVRYAAIPYHMLHSLDLNNPCITTIMSDTFKVTPKLCEERLQKIKNNAKQKEATHGKSRYVSS